MYKNFMKKKGWKKLATKSLVCGHCKSCNKELISNAGGWIVTHKREYFCHDGKEGSCFDVYCELKYKQQQEKQYANGRKKEVQLF